MKSLNKIEQLEIKVDMAYTACHSLKCGTRKHVIAYEKLCNARTELEQARHEEYLRFLDTDESYQ